jgi:hypothetical protein
MGGGISMPYLAAKVTGQGVAGSTKGVGAPLREREEVQTTSVNPAEALDHQGTTIGVALSEQFGDWANLAYFLEELTVVASARGEVMRSARLSLMLAVAEALFGLVSLGAPYLFVRCWPCARAAARVGVGSCRLVGGDGTLAQQIGVRAARGGGLPALAPP